MRRVQIKINMGERRLRKSNVKLCAGPIPAIPAIKESETEGSQFEPDPPKS
jgi:hypothetical protein